VKGLQSQSISITDCINLIEGFKDNFSTFRDNSKGEFNKIINLTNDGQKLNPQLGCQLPVPETEICQQGLGTRLLHLQWGKASWNEILDRQFIDLNSRF
jgi:hypothetical protein